MLQSLESRRLLSAAVVFEDATGVLAVTGSDKPDRIEVAVGSAPLCSLDGLGVGASRIASPAPPGNYVNVFDDGRLVYQSFLPGDGLKEIAVSGAGGADVLLTCNFESPVTTTVYGDDGNDSIDAVAFGGARGADVFGGDGDDMIRVGGQSKLGFLVWGEGGHDTIIGSGAPDKLFGDVDPTLVRQPPVYGDDVIYGGAGDDSLYGGNGIDMLFGQDGNDFLDGGDGSDLLDGGTGDDVGVFDPFDKMIVGIEHMTVGR